MASGELRVVEADAMLVVVERSVASVDQSVVTADMMRNILYFKLKLWGFGVLGYC